MDINLRLEELEKLVLAQGKDIEVLKETVTRVKNKQLLTQSVGMIANAEEEFEALQLLLASPSWPAAAEHNLICNITSDQDKQDRADGILDLIIDVHLEKLRLLDFGCGEGHVVDQSLKQNPVMSVGYDITHSEQWDKWEKTSKSLYTTDWAAVETNGPYNVVLLFDVIDHIMEGADHVDDVVKNLRRIRKVMAPNAKVFVRCHPWVSRHATHLYHKINKAFIHLVFTPEELQKLGYEGLPTRELIHPITNYKEWFKLAGFTAKNEKIVNDPTEPFFSATPIVAKRIKRQWLKSTDQDLREGKKFPWQLSMQFVDYILH